MEDITSFPSLAKKLTKIQVELTGKIKDNNHYTLARILLNNRLKNLSSIHDPSLCQFIQAMVYSSYPWSPMRLMVLVKWSCRFPPIMLIIELIMVGYFEHILFWWSFLDPHLTHTAQIKVSKLFLSWNEARQPYILVQHCYLHTYTTHLPTYQLAHPHEEKGRE